MSFLPLRLLLAASLLGGSIASAANLHWDGGTANLTDGADGVSTGGTGTWNTTLTNWDTGAAFQAWVNAQNDDAIFGGTAGTVTLGTNVTAGSLTFSVDGYTLTSSTLSLLNGITANGSATLSSGLALTGANTWTVASGKTLTIGGAVNTAGFRLEVGGAGNTAISTVVSGTGSVLKTGSGTLTLSNTANTFSGGLTVAGGTVIASGAQGAGATANLVTLGTTSADASFLAAFNTTVGQSITVSAAGSGVATIGGSSGSGANTQLNGTITLNRSATLFAGSNDRTTFTGKITGTGNLTIATPGTAGGRISFTQNTAGAANDFVGDITIQNGAQLQVGVAANSNNFAIPDAANIRFDAQSNSSTVNFRISGGGAAAETVNALISNAAGAGRISLTEGAAGTLTIGAGNGSGEFSGVITQGSGLVLSLTKVGTGNQTLSGANTFTGATTLSAGTLTLANASALGGSTLSLNGGTLALAPSLSTLTLGGLAATSAGPATNLALENNGSALALTLGGTGGTAVYAGVLSGAGSLTKSGTIDQTLAGNNSYSGGTTLSGGILRVARFDTALGSGSLAVTGNATLATASGGGGRTLSNAITVNSGQTLSLDAANAELVLASLISGQGVVQNASTGNVFLANAGNTFSGGIRVNSAGSIWVRGFGAADGTASPLGAATTVTLAANGSIGYLGAGETVAKTLNFSTTAGGIVTNHAASASASALTLSSVTAASVAMGVTFQGGSNTVLSNGITGSTNTLNFTKSGLGTLTVEGNISGSASNLRAQGGVLILNGTNSANATITGQRAVGAVIRFGSSSAIKTTQANTNGILAGWATWNGTDWASTNGTQVVSFTGTYASDTWASGSNINVTANSTQTGATANSLRFAAAAARTVTLSGTNFLQSGGILVTADVGANTTTITGGTLAFGTSGASSTGDIVLNNFNTGGELRIASVIANNAAGGTTSLTVSGPGVTRISGANSFTGRTYVHGGATLHNDSTANGGSWDKDYDVAADSALYLRTGFGSVGAQVVVHGAGVDNTTRGLFLRAGQNYNFNGTLTLSGSPTTIRSYESGNAALTGWDIGTAQLSVNSTASGSVISGSVVLTASSYGYRMEVSPGLATATGDLVVNAGLAGTAGSWGASGQTMNGGAVQAVDFRINQSGATGSVRLNAAGTLGIGTQIFSGSVIAGADNVLGSTKALILGNSTNSGKLILNGYRQSLGNLGTIGTGTANAIVGGSATLSTLTVSNSVAALYGGVFGGVLANENNLALVKSGSGTLTLTGVNTHTGGTTVNAGTLALGHATSTLTDTGAVTVDGATAVLSLDANSDTVGALALRNGGSITGTTGVLTASSYALESGSVSAILGGAAALAKTTAGTVTLAAANTFSGGTSVTAGTLALESAGTLGSGAVAVASGATLSYNRAGAFTLAHTLSGEGTWSKSQSGVATQSGSAAGFAGTLLVNAGSLNYTAAAELGYASASVARGANLSVASHTLGAGRTLSLAGAAVNDASAADFTGNLTLVGDLVASGGILQVGGALAAGTVLIDGDLSVSDFAELRYDFAPTTDLGGGVNDLLRVEGNVVLGTAAHVVISGGSLASSTYRILTYTGELTGFENLSAKFISNTRSTFTATHDVAAKAVDITVGTAAANLTWTGSASQSWNVTSDANFDNDGTASADQFFGADNIAFAGAGAGTVTLAEAITAGAVTVSGSSDYAFAGGFDLVASSLAKSGSAKLTLATPTTVSGGATLSEGTLEIATGGSLTSSLAVSGGSTLTLSAGTLAGSVAVANGTVALSGGTASSALALNGGTLSLSSGTASGRITVGGGAATLSGGTASGGLTVDSGSATVSGATVSGTVFVNGGTLGVSSGTLSSLLTVAGGEATLTGGTASGGLTLDSGAATVNGATLTGAVAVNGGTLSYLSAATLAGNHTVGASGQLILSQAGTQTLAGSLAGSGLVTKRGAGTLVFNPSADSTFSGTLAVEAGTLRIGPANLNNPNTFTTSAASSGSLTLANGTVLDLAREHGTTGETTNWADLPLVTLSQGSTVRFRASLGSNTHNASFNLAVNGNATLDNNGGGYEQNITFNGALTGSSQLSYIQSSNPGGAAYDRTLTLTSANSAFSGNWFVDNTNGGDDFAVVRSNAAGALGTGTVILDDSAKLVNNASGGINSLAGVTLQKSTATLNLSSFAWNNASAALTLAGGTVTLGAATSSIGNLSGTGGTIQAGNAASGFTVNQTADATYAGTFTSSGAGAALAFTKAGAATLTLTGQSTATGTYAVTAGKLVLSGGESRLSAASAVTVGSGATLEVAATNAIRRQTPASNGLITLDGGTLLLSGSGTQGAHLGHLTLNSGASLAAATGAGSYRFWNFNLNGDVAVGGSSASAISAAIGLGGSLAFNVGNATGSADVDLDITGVIHDGDTAAGAYALGAIVKSGAGTLRLGAANLFTGGLVVNDGTVLLGHASSLGAGAAAVTISGGTLDLGGHAVARNLTLAAGTLAGAGSYTGQVSLTGDATLGGTIGGTVALGNNDSREVTLAAGSATFTGTLQGVGTLLGDVTLSGAIHNPGNSPGIQVVDGNLTYSGAANTVVWELSDNTDLNLPVAFDQIVVTGNLAFDSATLLQLNFATDSTVDWNNEFWANDHTWVIFDVTGSTSGFANLSLDANDLDLYGASLAAIRPYASFSLAQIDGDVALQYSPVPEPSTYGLALGALALAAAALRRRRKSD